METIREYVQKWAGYWRSIGVIIATIAAMGILIPDWVSNLFGEGVIAIVVEFVEIALVFVGAAIAAYNNLRKELAKKPSENPDTEPAVVSLSKSALKAYRKPFGRVA